MSAKTHFFFVGALLLLWAPRGIDQFRVVVPQQLQHPPAPQPQHPPANGSWRERTPKDAFSFTLDVVPSARSTRLTGINDLGDVIGTYNLNELRTQYFLRLSDGIPMAIKHPQAPDDTRLTGLNNKGEVVGNFHEATRTGHDQRSYGFVRRQDGTFESFDCLDSSNTEATAINDHGQIVGFALDATRGQRAFLRERNGTCLPITPPDADLLGYATGINNNGEIIGVWLVPKVGQRSFLRRRDGTYIAIQPDPGVVQAAAINDDGVVVGRTELGGFLWRHKGPPLALEHPRCYAEGIACTYPKGINNSREIVGVFEIGGISYGFRATLKSPK